jgi:Sugar (pentulose and hexulose) kinases
MKYTIGIDIGTGSVKAVALDSHGKILTQAQLHYPSSPGEHGIAEQDPVMVTHLFIKCIRQVTDSLHGSPQLIALGSYMHGIMAVDDKCLPLTNILTWADIRSESIASDIRLSNEAESIYRASGAPLHSMLPLFKIIWWQQNEPGICQRAFKFISIKEFIWYQLFKDFQIDESIANATGMFDIVQRQWNKRAIQLCGISVQQLSEIVPVTYIRIGIQPAICSVLNIDANTQVCVGGSDGCMAVIGSGAAKPSLASLTIGTSGAVRVFSSKPVLNFPEMTFSYAIGKSAFVCGAPINNGGNVMQWVLEHFLKTKELINYPSLFEAIDRMPPGSEGLIFLPYLFGERAPLWDEKACGAFFGIRDQHTTDHFMRATAEGICYALREVLELLEQSTSIMEVMVSGGFTKSYSWMQMLADITGKTLVLHQSEDASALGAALVGMKEIKWIGEYDNYFSTVSAQRIYANARNHQRYTQLFPIYKKLSRTLKGLMGELYQIEHG